nr:MAG TPA: hypothetical protein [Caudoviricetes sp.]
MTTKKLPSNVGFGLSTIQDMKDNPKPYAEALYNMRDVPAMMIGEGLKLPIDALTGMVYLNPSAHLLNSVAGDPVEIMQSNWTNLINNKVLPNIVSNKGKQELKYIQEAALNTPIKEYIENAPQYSFSKGSSLLVGAPTKATRSLIDLHHYGRGSILENGLALLKHFIAKRPKVTSDTYSKLGDALGE